MQILKYQAMLTGWVDKTTPDKCGWGELTTDLI